MCGIVYECGAVSRDCHVISRCTDRPPFGSCDCHQVSSVTWFSSLSSRAWAGTMADHHLCHVIVTWSPVVHNCVRCLNIILCGVGSRGTSHAFSHTLCHDSYVTSFTLLYDHVWAQSPRGACSLHSERPAAPSMVTISYFCAPFKVPWSPRDPPAYSFFNNDIMSRAKVNHRHDVTSRDSTF